MIPLDFFTIQTPSLLFPTVSLLMLAYTNRFLGITSVIRKLHDDMGKSTDNQAFYYSQIQSLSARIKLIIIAQKMGVASLIGCVLSMIAIFASLIASVIIFGIALILTMGSLIVIFKELTISNEALDYILKDCIKINNEKK